MLAHLCHLATIPLRGLVPCRWVRVRPIANPDCETVADYFVEHWYLDYATVDVECSRDLFGYHASGTLERGFAHVIAEVGADRHISGVRGQESGERTRRMRRWGTETAKTLAPLGW